MQRLILGVMAILALACLAPQGVQARDYYEWSTRRPFSGWVWGGRRSYYCDYIRYPKRDCRPRKVCRGGRCSVQERCRVVGWDIRQSCY